MDGGARGQGKLSSGVRFCFSVVDGAGCSVPLRNWGISVYGLGRTAFCSVLLRNWGAVGVGGVDKREYIDYLSTTTFL